MALRAPSARLQRAIAALLALVAATAPGVAAQQGVTASLQAPGISSVEEPADVRLFNEYIAITVNATQENTGRFSVQTTGGDPDRPSDDESPLIYKQPGQSPWTSYATIRIDGIDYVFGGEPTERAGRAALFGTVLSPPQVIDGNRIETAYRVGPIEAVQSLTIIRSSTTGLLDTARIEYTLTNVGQRTHDVGFRLMLDTMLGANDGAPFRVEELAITSDTSFVGEQIPDFWQAFDSLQDPKVTAQGSFRGGDVTTPDRVYFTNWGAVADGPWDFDFQPGRDFTRLGEFELDSALALYWDPRPLAPGESRSFVTHYGLGGISISPGLLSIGVTSPASVTADTGAEVSFPIVAYIQNTGEGEARSVVARLSLPRGLRPAEGVDLEVDLGNLPSGRVSQVTWRVALDGAVGGTLTYAVRVEAINAEPNEVSRSVEVVPPAKLAIEIHNKNGRLQVTEDRWEPLPYPITATVRNEGGAEASSVTVRWETHLLELAPGDRAEKPIGPVGPGEEVEVSWRVRPLTVTPSQRYPFTGNLAYAIKASIAGNAEEFRAEGYLDVPHLESQVKFEVEPLGADGVIRTGDFFLVRVKTQNVRAFHGAELSVAFDPSALELVGGAFGVDVGRLFIRLHQDGRREVLGWSPAQYELDPGTNRATVRIRGDRRGAEPLFWVSDTVATLRFQAKKAGEHALTFTGVRVVDQNNQGVNVNLVNGSVRVTN